MMRLQHIHHATTFICSAPIPALQVFGSRTVKLILSDEGKARRARLVWHMNVWMTSMANLIHFRLSCQSATLGTAFEEVQIGCQIRLASYSVSSATAYRPLEGSMHTARERVFAMCLCLPLVPNLSGNRTQQQGRYHR